MGITMDAINIEILKCLYKCEFLHEDHLAALIGENRDFLKGRLKRLAKAGLIERKIIQGNRTSVNWITKKGIREIGLAMRNVREPNTGRYEHALGCADMYVFLTLMRKTKNSSIRRIVNFGMIITERDFNAVREMLEIKKKSNGQPVYVSLDRHIHAPDGYYGVNDKYVALEYERIPKNKYKIMRDNIFENRKRFCRQIWFYGKPIVGKILNKIKDELGDEIVIISMDAAREQIMRYVNALPDEISAKSGIPRNSALGEMVEPIPLNKLPVFADRNQSPRLESRPVQGSNLGSTTSTNGQHLFVATHGDVDSTGSGLQKAMAYSQTEPRTASDRNTSDESSGSHMDKPGTRTGQNRAHPVSNIILEKRRNS